MKKMLNLLMPLLLSVAVISGCGSNPTASTQTDGKAAANAGLENSQQSANTSTGNSNSKPAETTGYVPETLTVQFVPSQNADTLEAKAKPLEKLLSDKVGIPVKVSVSTDYNTIVEAMASKKIDVGFLPPTAYVLAKDRGAAEVILQAQRFGVKDETGEATDELVDFYKAMIIVKKDSAIQSVTDLKGKKIAYQNVSSSAGYVWPAGYLLDNGLDPLEDVMPITVKGHDQAVLAVLNSDVDAAAIFQDARNIVKNDYPTVFEDTRVLAYTEKIPNDTVSVRADMSPEWIEKLQNAFIEIGQDEEGHKIISEIYTHEGYVKSDDSNFKVVREYGEKVKTE